MNALECYESYIRANRDYMDIINLRPWNSSF